MPISPFCNILQSVAALSTSSNCLRARYVLQRLCRPHATPSPLQVATLSTSPVCPPALHVLQHAHARPIFRPSPACACLATPHSPPFGSPVCTCLATPHSPPFPRVRMSYNTSQSARPPRAHALQHLTVRPSPACACLATPHSPPFPRVRMSCNTSQSALPPPARVRPTYCNTYLSPSCITSQPASAPPAPMYCLSRHLAKCSTCCSILEY